MTRVPDRTVWPFVNASLMLVSGDDLRTIHFPSCGDTLLLFPPTAEGMATAASIFKEYGDMVAEVEKREIARLEALMAEKINDEYAADDEFRILNGLTE